MLNFRDLLGVDIPEPDCCTIGSNERRRGGATGAASVRQAYTDHDLIRGLSFSLVRGAIGWLPGSSGCGTTTVLRRIARFEPASDGEILLHGQVVTRRGLTVAPEKRRIGMVFQRYALFPHLSVAESARMVSRVENRAMTRTMRRGVRQPRRRSAVMANIIIRSGSLLDDIFGDLMKGFWEKPMTLADEQELDIRIDVKEDDKAYLVKADIPGVTKEDIRVDVDGNLVSIRAEVKRASEAKDGERVLRSECYAGTVSRSFTLPYDLDLEGADAKYADGVLELRLPKKSGAAARQLTVK